MLKLLMTKQVVLGMFRHVLTTGGGVLVADGLLDASTMNEVIGALMIVVGAAWSVYEKREK